MKLTEEQRESLRMFMDRQWTPHDPKPIFFTDYPEAMSPDEYIDGFEHWLNEEHLMVITDGDTNA